MPAQHVAREVEVARDPVAHFRQVLAEAERHDVLGPADEDRAIAHAGMALDMLDHLGVVVGRQEGLALAARRHGHEAHEVGEPGELGLLELGMLMPVVVDVPGLVGDDQVVVARIDGVLEGHEVLDQHLVHAADRLEGVEIVLARLFLDVTRFAGEPRAQRMDGLAVGHQQARHRILRQPVDLEAGMELAQFLRDGDVAAAVAEADRRGEIERALLLSSRAAPA